ncbi:MAG: MMPL family transporter [Treponema sp.]|nr:MMPL family transporter [Treponema sp.]
MLGKIFKHPTLIVAVIGLITLFFALQLPRAQLDNNNFRFVPENDEARLTSKYIDDTFGSSTFILVGLERKYGTVFDGAFLAQVRDFVTRIGEIEIVGTVNSMVSSDYITSSGDAIVVEKLVPDAFSGTPEEISELKRRLLSWNLYRRALISDDFSATQILVPLDIESDDAGRADVITEFMQIRDIAREMFAGQAEVYVTGLPVISATINEAVNADLKFLVPLVIVVVLSVLFFSFRRLTPVVLPLLTVVVAVIWSVGAMPLVGVKLSVLSTVLPVILVAVGSAYGIHVITHYIEERGALTLDAAAHYSLVMKLLRKIGKPVLLAALTTFVGFASCCFTEVPPIREFGIFSSLGVVVSFIIAVTLIPALLLIRGPKPLKAKREKRSAEHGEDPLSAAIADTFVAITRKKRFVLVVTALVMAVSLYGLSKIIIDNVMVEYFRDDTDISRSDRFIREKFGGSKVISIVAEAETSAELLHPASLGLMDRLNTFIEERIPNTGKVMGFTDLIKRINQVFNADESAAGLAGNAVSDTDFGADDGFGFGFDDADAGFGFGDDAGFGFDDIVPDIVPVTPPAAAPAFTNDEPLSAAQLMALLDRAASSGSDRSISADRLVWELQRLTNYDGVSYYEVPTDPARYGKRRPEDLAQLVSNYLVLLSGSIADYANDALEPTAIKTSVQFRTSGAIDTNIAINEIRNFVNANFPQNINVIIGGGALVENSINVLVVRSQLTSVFISLFMVLLIIAVSNRSLIAGVIGIVPLSISILINFAVMGFLGIKLNIGTSLVATLSIGIGIDYTIHYIEAFKREYRATDGGGDFLRRTFTTSGKAILINAVSVGAGFAVLTLSRFTMLADLGLLIALTMATSAFVSLTTIPVLLLLIKPQFITRKE